MRVSALWPCGGCGLQDGPRAENLRWRDRQRPPVSTAPLPESSIVIQPNEVCAAATALGCIGFWPGTGHVAAAGLVAKVLAMSSLRPWRHPHRRDVIELR